MVDLVSCPPYVIHYEVFPPADSIMARLFLCAIFTVVRALKGPVVYTLLPRSGSVVRTIVE